MSVIYYRYDLSYLQSAVFFGICNLHLPRGNWRFDILPLKVGMNMESVNIGAGVTQRPVNQNCFFLQF